MGLGRTVATGLLAAVVTVGMAACTADTPTSTAQSEGSGAGAQTSSGATGGGDTATGSDITALFDRAQTSEDIPDTETTAIDASTSRFIGESSGTRFYIARSPSDDAVLCLVVDRTDPGDPPASGGEDQDSVSRGRRPAAMTGSHSSWTTPSTSCTRTRSGSPRAAATSSAATSRSWTTSGSESAGPAQVFGTGPVPVVS